MNNKSIQTPYMATICFTWENLPQGRIARRALLNSLLQVCPSAVIVGGSRNKLIIRFDVVVYKEWQQMSPEGLAFIAINKLFERLSKNHLNFDFFEHSDHIAVVEISNPVKVSWKVDMADFLSGNEEPRENDIDILTNS